MSEKIRDKCSVSMIKIPSPSCFSLYINIVLQIQLKFLTKSHSNIYYSTLISVSALECLDDCVVPWVGKVLQEVVEGSLSGDVVLDDES